MIPCIYLVFYLQQYKITLLNRFYEQLLRLQLAIWGAPLTLDILRRAALTGLTFKMSYCVDDFADINRQRSIDIINTHIATKCLYWLCLLISTPCNTEYSMWYSFICDILPPIATLYEKKCFIYHVKFWDLKKNYWTQFEEKYIKYCFWQLATQL